MALEASFEVKGHQELVDAMKQVPAIAEQTVNEVLHGKGGQELTRGIFNFMPLSKKKSSWKSSGPHARNSKSLKADPVNLGVTVKRASAKWNYLVFPNDGIGKRNQIKQQFFEKGLESVSDNITEMLLDALIEKI